MFQIIRESLFRKFRGSKSEAAGLCRFRTQVIEVGEGKAKVSPGRKKGGMGKERTCYQEGEPGTTCAGKGSVNGDPQWPQALLRAV